MSEMLGEKIRLGERAEKVPEERETLAAPRARWGLESGDEG